MHRARALRGRGDVRQRLDIDEICAVAPRHAEASDAVRLVDFLVTHEPEQFRGGAVVPQAKRCGVEAADGVLSVDAAVAPGQASVALALDQREAIAIGTGEMQALLAEGFVSLQAVDVVRGEPFHPERQRALGHGENSFADLARARAPASDIWE